MDNPDPAATFFGEEEVDLYAVLSVEDKATLNDIKKSYRKKCLLYHPDKHSTLLSVSEKAEASLKFQQVGFAYTVLSDESRRARYDSTGKTDEGFDLSAGEDGWEAYFEAIFDRATRNKLDEMKLEYQGSSEETEDIKKAYHDCNGGIAEILTHIPHSTTDDEPRFINLISHLIVSKDLPALDAWESSVHDEKARLVRKKQAGKEAKEAEKLAKDLGVWDEFYGSGKASEKKKKGKGKGKQTDADEEDHSALQALILKKRKNSNVDSFYDGLAAKYAQPEPKSKGKGKGKKRASAAGEDEEDAPRKKSKRAATPELDDAAFEALQKSLFGGDKGASTAGTAKQKAPAKARIAKK